ncbi:hypothetical protein NKG05_23795 [Oerskovia sp. M15]
MHGHPAARLGRRDAGTRGHVARAGRRGEPHQAAHGRREHLHGPGDRDRRVQRGEAQGAGFQVRDHDAAARSQPRAKMLGMRDGFVKLFAHPEASVVLGGVVVAPRASELIFPITLAVAHRLTVDDVAEAFTVYPSLTGSIAEVARMLHHRQD